MNLTGYISSKGNDSSVQLEKSNTEVVTTEDKTLSDQAADKDLYLLPLHDRNTKIEFIPSRRKTTRRISVRVEGEFGISVVAALKDRLLKVLENFDYIDLKLRNILQIDLAAIQLIYVLKHATGPENKVISVDADFSDDDRTMIGNSGFQDLFRKPGLSV